MRFTLWELLQVIWDNICREPDVRNALFAAFWGGLIIQAAMLSAKYWIIDNEATLMWLRVLNLSFGCCIGGFLIAKGLWRRF